MHIAQRENNKQVNANQSQQCMCDGMLFSNCFSFTIPLKCTSKVLMSRGTDGLFRRNLCCCAN